MNNPWFSKIAVWMVIAMVLFTVFKQFDSRGGAGAGYMGYSDFLEEVRASRIKSATIQEGQGGTEIVATTTDDRRVKTTATYLDRGLVGDLIAFYEKRGIKVILLSEYGITDVDGRTPPSHRAMLGDPRVPSDVVVR